MPKVRDVAVAAGGSRRSTGAASGARLAAAGPRAAIIHPAHGEAGAARPVIANGGAA
jgi:hypothetical protein